MCNWKNRDPNAPLATWGRKPHSTAAQREARLRVREEMKRQGDGAGEPSLWAALKGRVSRRLLRRALARCKRVLRRWQARRRAARTLRIVPAAPGILGSLDAGQFGRVGDLPVKSLQLVDALSFKTIVARVGWTPTGKDVVRLLKWLLESADGLPLAVLLDRGSENVNRRVRRFAKRHHLVLIFNVPRTPQHNPWVERKWKDQRSVSGLRACTPLASLEEARGRFDAATAVLDHARLRAKHGGITAAQRDAIGRVRYSAALRERLWNDVRAAVERARAACARPRDRPRAEREAALAVLDVYGMIERYRGGVRVRSA